MRRPHGALAWAELALALLITALIVSLNLRFATQAGPLWRDEVSTVQLATRSTYTEVLRSLSLDRKSTRLNSSHGYISYAVFCLKKKKKKNTTYCATSVTVHTH